MLYKISMAAGIILVLSAASNDDLYGCAYPLTKLLLTGGAGLVLILIGSIPLFRSERRKENEN